MFKAATNRLVERKALTKSDALSYFIKCLVYNAPDGLFRAKLARRPAAVVGWLKKAKLKDFESPNGRIHESWHLAGKVCGDHALPKRLTDMRMY